MAFHNESSFENLCSKVISFLQRFIKDLNKSETKKIFRSNPVFSLCYFNVTMNYSETNISRMEIVIIQAFLGLILLLSSGIGLAFVEGRLLNQSTSGQTAVFNVGSHDKIYDGDYAVIVKQIKNLEIPDLKLVPVAKARNIKTTTDGSIWILYHVYDGELLVSGDKYILLTETNVLKGQNLPKVSTHTVVTTKGSESGQVKSVLAEDKDRLAKKAHEYNVIDKMHNQEVRSDEDVTLLDVENWNKEKNLRYRSSIYKSANKDEFKKAYRLDNFHRLVTDYLKRMNDPEFKYDKFYAHQMREDYANEFRKGTNFNTEYEDFLFKQSQKSHKEAKIYRSILKRGESWSEDFSDEELRNVLSNVSIVNEEERRVEVVSKPIRHALFFDYGLILNDAQTSDDTSYRRDKLYQFALDIEVTPFLKHPILERFTFYASPQITKSAFEVESINLNFDNISIAGGANWYPFHAPYIVYTPLLFLGMYVRYGYSVVESPVTSDAGKYSTFSFPGIRGGLRYIFKNQIGLRIVTSVETLKLERYEVNRFKRFG